jgi:hypothetical protein
MHYAKLQNLQEESFRRLTGISRQLFERQVVILNEAEKEKKRLGGKPSRLSMEDRLLMALAYWREYRTYFHIGASFGMSESACYRTIKWIEDTLVKHPEFALPGRKALLEGDGEYEVVLLDASETPIERPKKNKKDTIQGRRNVTP